VKENITKIIKEKYIYDTILYLSKKSAYKQTHIVQTRVEGVTVLKTKQKTHTQNIKLLR